MHNACCNALHIYIPTERFVLTSNAHHFIPNWIVQKIWGMCSIFSPIFSKQSSFLFSILTQKTTNDVCRALDLKRPEITFLWNSPLKKKTQNQSRRKSDLSLQRVIYVSWCKSRKSVRSDAFTGNWHKSRPTQLCLSTAATELIPFLVCWEFEETLKDYFLVCGLQNRAAFED